MHVRVWAALLLITPQAGAIRVQQQQPVRAQRSPAPADCFPSSGYETEALGLAPAFRPECQAASPIPFAFGFSLFGNRGELPGHFSPEDHRETMSRSITPYSGLINPSAASSFFDFFKPRRDAPASPWPAFPDLENQGRVLSEAEMTPGLQQRIAQYRATPAATPFRNRIAGHVPEMRTDAAPQAPAEAPRPSLGARAGSMVRGAAQRVAGAIRQLPEQAASVAGAVRDTVRDAVQNPRETLNRAATAIAGAFQGLLRPVGQIRSLFGPRRAPKPGASTFHRGIDFAAPMGTAVQNAGKGQGEVADTGYDGGYGNYIKLRHAGGYETFYAHLSSIGVRKGQPVREGMVIGQVGSTGVSTGPHLHLELHRYGAPVDPAPYLGGAQIAGNGTPRPHG